MNLIRWMHEEWCTRLHLPAINIARFLSLDARRFRYMPALYVWIALSIQAVSASRFHSRDPHVTELIGECERKISADSQNFPTGDTRCQAVLGCILRNNGAYTAARWSAGASILAFIPTIAGVMSNSIEEINLIAEGNEILAIMMGLCSVTVFASRFGSGRETHTRTADAIFEHIRHKIEKRTKATQADTRWSRWKPRLVLSSAYLILATACFTVWFPTVVILRNGVVVFSCPWRIHVPLWVGLGQSVVIANVLLRRLTFDKTIMLHHRGAGSRTKTSSRDRKRSAQLSVILRVAKTGFVPRIIRGFTSTITFALYAFGTAIFSAMTLFTASDSVWCLVLFAFAAGMGRVVANFVTDDQFGCLRTIVFDVQDQQVNELKKRVEEIIQ